MNRDEFAIPLPSEARIMKDLPAMPVPTEELERHPWNRSFVWETHEGPFEVLGADQAAQFDRDGFVVLHDVFNTSEVAAIVEEVDGFEAELEELLRQVEGGRVSIAEAGAITFTT